MDDWSAPDARGVCTQTLDVGARATLRGRRRRRSVRRVDDAAATWPADWRDLARDWFSSGARLRWDSLLKRAGPTRVATAAELLDALLVAGWIVLDERREPGGRWRPLQVEVLALEASREALGLPNRERLAADWAQARNLPLTDPALAAAAAQLDALAPALALRRQRWLLALDRWQAGRCSGTRRDFAYFASGHTKGIADADWAWLDTALALDSFGIDPHTPLLLVRGALSLLFDAGRIDLATMPDFAGITPATLVACRAVAGTITHYRLIENRTSFEHACRAPAHTEALIWLPGNPPQWWRDAISRLLALHPAKALIEADPDPAGIAIACSAGRLWAEKGLRWEPANMDPAALDRLPQTQALTAADHAELERLLAAHLPPALHVLAQVLRERGIKGEQEGLRAPGGS